jgi:5,5'-dehydrodivanillate O-demethylase
MSVAEPISTNATSAKSPRDFYGEFHKTAADTLGGKYLRQFWHPIARACDLAPGRAQPIRVLSEDFTLYRGEDGTPHLTVHRCPHRGTALSVGVVEGSSIRCHYHGWKFGADGVCTARPAEPNGGGNVKIRTYPCAEFLGLIYGYFGDGEAPAFPPYPGFVKEGIPETLRAVFPCNWFQSWENDFDLFHARWTHRTGEIHGPMAGPNRDNFYAGILNSEAYEETDYGIVRRITVMGGVNASVLFMPGTVRLLIPTFNEQARRTGLQLRETYLSHTPIDDHSHIAFLTQLVPVTGAEQESYLREHAEIEKMKATLPSPVEQAEKIMAGTHQITDFKDHPMLVEIEDLIAQVGQGVIADRHNEILGRSDVGVMFLRRVLARELQALSEGRRSKAWSFMSEAPAGMITPLMATPEQGGPPAPGGHG